jgi:hypothetical protein
VTGSERQRTPEGATAGVGVVIIIAAPSATPEGIASIPKPTI